MLKTGIYVDSLNIQMNGGYGIRYDTLYNYAQRDSTVIRANSYLCEDRDRKYEDPEYYKNITNYHKKLRQCGFKVIVSPISKFRDDNGEIVVKANVDMDIGLDMVQQGPHFDHVILLSGDGDFTKPVEMLQNSGTRVEVVAFEKVSNKLTRVADIYTNGFLIPNLLPCDRQRGFVIRYNDEKGFGFLRYYNEDFSPSDAFFHITEVDKPDNLKPNQPTPIFEFDLVENEDGKPRAVNLKTVCLDGNI